MTSPKQQWGRKELPQDKEQQLENFASLLLEDVERYYETFKLPLQWTKMRTSLRRMYAPLATNEEVRQYVTKNKLTAVVTLSNNVGYMPKAIELSQFELVSLRNRFDAFITEKRKESRKRSF